MVIKVLGTGCKNCVRLEDLAKQAVAELGLDAEVIKVSDLPSIMSYGIMSTPALVVDEQVRLAGRVPRLDEVKTILQGA